MYRTLFENNKSIIVFDDCDAVLKDPVALNLLKGALDSYGKRIMSWNADTTRLPERMHSEYLDTLFLKDDLTEGHYKVAGVPVALKNLKMPLMVVVILLLLMVQLQHFGRTAMVLLTAPLGIIGASLGLNVASAPFGFVALLGLGIVAATAETKAVNFASNIAGLATLAFSGQIFWVVGFLMGAAQIAGASLGARAAIRTGARLIKPLVVGVSLLLALKLAADAVK